MDYYKMLGQLVNDNKGIITAKEVTELGIPRTYIAELVKKGTLKRYERGVYISVQNDFDMMYCFQMRFAQIIFSHESALFLHGYLEDFPQANVVTVKTGINTKILTKSGARVHSIRPELYTLGETEVETRYGRTVRVYDIERSICDIVRNRRRIDNEVLVSTLRKYNNSPEKDISKLLDYAEKLKVSKILNTYLDFMY